VQIAAVTNPTRIDFKSRLSLLEEGVAFLPLDASTRTGDIPMDLHLAMHSPLLTASMTSVRIAPSLLLYETENVIFPPLLNRHAIL
jgi:hypothetical protein